jgi:micrococcal nuclease
MRFLHSLVVSVLVLGPACATPRIDANAPVFPTPLETSVMPAPPSTARHAHVVRVVDGDTVVLDGIGRARLIGIDTPEVRAGYECFGREATSYVKRVLKSRDVRVDLDVDTVDRYGRTLVYIWNDTTFVNGSLVADGFAVPMTVPPNVRYADLFADLAARAHEQQRGLWSAC